jgi:hypothetical protein
LVSKRRVIRTIKRTGRASLFKSLLFPLKVRISGTHRHREKSREREEFEEQQISIQKNKGVAKNYVR